MTDIIITQDDLGHSSVIITTTSRNSQEVRVSISSTFDHTHFAVYTKNVEYTSTVLCMCTINPYVLR